jgi:hypothetical protein
MPLTRYFLFVGGVLLALLFVVGAVLPQLPVADTDRADAEVDKSTIRIHSDRKWPERVVFDTSLPTIVPGQTLKAAAAIPAPAPAIVADVAPKARVREAFAQLVPPESKKPEPKLQKLHRKPKIAKTRAAPPPVVMVAQQPPRFGFFANSTW